MNIRRTHRSGNKLFLTSTAFSMQMPTSTARSPRLLNAAVVVAALGYFVDIYDLLLFGIVRVASLQSLGLTGENLTRQGEFLINMQMIGMLIGGILWGVLGDKKGRLSVLFGSIFIYSVANIANGFVQGVEGYALWRFVAGIGLAGELGAGITLVSEVLPKEKRGIGTMIVASVGLTGAVVANSYTSFPATGGCATSLEEGWDCACCFCVSG
jgi:MFS family permease